MDKGYYYADENGVLATDTVIDNYKLDANGKSATKYRIIQYVKKHTKDSMTDQQKIDALYNWILKNDMTYIRTYEHVKQDWVWKDSWVDDMAKSQMDNWGGNCYRYASFFGMLVHEATGLPVNVYHGLTISVSNTLVPHGWASVCQDGVWYVYDVELHKFSTYTKEHCYKIPEAECTMHAEGVPTTLNS